MSPYRALIAQHTTADPAHVEAWMRLSHGTLDHLSPAEFAAEVRVAEACIRESTPADTAELAKSYGL